MAKKRLNSDQDEFEFQSELAPSVIRSQIVIDGVTISGSDWETLTGESRILPVRLIRIPDEQTRDQEQSERVGLALRQMQSMLPEDRDYTIEVTRNCVKVTNENGKMEEEVIRSLCIPAEMLQGDFNYSSARLDANLVPPKKPVESRALIVRP